MYDKNIRQVGSGGLESVRPPLPHEGEPLAARLHNVEGDVFEAFAWAVRQIEEIKGRITYLETRLEGERMGLETAQPVPPNLIVRVS